MTSATKIMLLAPLLLPITGSASAQTWITQEPPYGRPDDLRTKEGVELVKGQWKHNVRIIETDRPSGISPDRGGASGWEQGRA